MPIVFTSECLSWFRAGRDRPEAERTFNDAEAEELCKMFAERINSGADCSLIRDQPNLLMLMYVWSTFGRADAPRELLQKCFQAEPTLVVRYLRSAVGMAYPADGRRPHPGDFEKDAYDAVSKYVDGATINDALLKVFGDRLAVSPPRFRDHANPDERIAQEFAVLHRTAQQRAA